ncbi:MAG: permease prefix domain 1-containing protein, partial [Lentisphaerae bacterium]|nr:permease prefix domain 1-containing protein [Lentisphaerota bacterium]
MDEHKQSEDFLNAATAGLKNDPELQLDVKAELRTHLEEHQCEAEVKGLAPDAAAEEAVRAMGQPAELAASLESANRHRMRLRSLIKIAAQWLLAPLAIAIAVMTTDWVEFQAVNMLNSLTGTGYAFGPDINSVQRKLSPDQRLVLYGDPARKSFADKQKAIWEKWPKSKIYLHNYITHLISGAATGHYAELAAEIAKLQPLDPDNARFDYILAGRLLDQAVDIKSSSEKGPDGKPKTVYDTTIKDRAKLDEAMLHLKAGLAKPEFRRYTREMAVERLAIMGEPTSLLQEIQEISMLAGILLPDLSHLRNLERTSVFYGELLANEGKRKEADIFL